MNPKRRLSDRRLRFEGVVCMNELYRIRVLIVDDHRVVRSGLTAFLGIFDDLELVGEAASGKDAVHLCPQVRPDVVLMDLVMPGMDGTTATRIIRQQYPHVQVIALTSFREHELVQAVLQAGAIGYLLKNVTADELADAVRAAYAGRPTLASEVTETLIYGITHPYTPSLDLTAREREVLALMVKGLSNTDIAAQLVVSRSTVKFYVSSILAKLHVASRVEAVALAVERHLVMRPVQNLAS
jgi:NarL family two-component system response regulator LiaR